MCHGILHHAQIVLQLMRHFQLCIDGLLSGANAICPLWYCGDFCGKFKALQDAHPTCLNQQGNAMFAVS